MLSHEIRVDDHNYKRLIELCHALRDDAPIIMINDAINYLFEQVIGNEDLEEMYGHTRKD